MNTVNIVMLEKDGIQFIKEDKILKEKSRDWSFTSPILKKLSNKIADAVVIPKNEEDVIKVVEYAIENHIPIIPRGGGYSTVGGIIPMKGGIIIDMSNLSGVIEEDEDTITVFAGTRFFDKGKMLFNPRVYPTIYQKTTIGGYFCGGSWGIGSFMFGPNWDQVVELKMVNPKGKLVTLRGGDIKIAAHAEGTTGIVTRLKILKMNEEGFIPQILLFDSLPQAVKFVEKIYDELPEEIYHMTLRSPEITHLTKDITNFDTDKWSLLIVSKEKFENSLDGKILWEKRNVFFAGVYSNIALKKDRVYYAQYHIPINELEGKIMKVRESIDVVIESEFANDGKGHTYFMTFDEQSFYEVKKVLGETNFDLHSIYINNRLERPHLQRIIMYKKSYDKEDLFNPGKVNLGKSL
ncbi:FAD-binding protein [Acidianus sulfidivorans JP7]|nr:FAD-binding protein [Acidianus sulfidivorans JP7]